LPITQFVEPHEIRLAAFRANPGLVVIDAEGRRFSKIRAMDLGTAIWRTTQLPSSRTLADGTIVMFVTEGKPPWEAIRECCRRYPTIVAAEDGSAEDALAALRAGAFGYIDLAISDQSVRRTLLGALKGEPAFQRNVMGAWLREGRPRAAEGVSTERLTARQREIVALIAGGATDKEIGAKLGIRTATAQKHVANLLRRLGVANRAAAVGVVFKGVESAPAGPRPDRRRR
jgi:DNA-binding NarL/FixJ family response regulator